MPLDERSRLTFHAWLVDHDLDHEVASAILGVMPPFDWHEIPKRADIDRRFDDVDRRFSRIDARFEQIPLSPLEARAFLDAVRGDRLEALYAVAVAIGLRQGEILGLRWSDVDLDGGTIRVSQALQRVGGRMTFVEPKSLRSRRTIPMPPTVARALRAHRARQLEERLAGGPDWNAHDLVFISTTGTPLDGRNLTRRFQAVLERAGLPRMRFHDARHTCATLLLA